MARLIPPIGDSSEVHPANGKHFSLKELQGYVGGYVQEISVGGRTSMMMNEDGKSADPPLARNELATVMLHGAGGMPGDFVVGTVLIVAYTELAHGDEEEGGDDDA